MDLDKVKKSWQEARIAHIVDDDKIQRMIDNKGQGAYAVLIRRERNILWMGLALPIVFWILDYFYSFSSVAILFYAACVAGTIWQSYKYAYLKKLNVEKANIITVSKHFTRYIKYIIIEFILMSIWVLIFLTVFIFTVPPVSDMPILRLSCILAILFILFMWYGVVIYKSTYWKSITILRCSLKEAEETGTEAGEDKSI